MDDSRGALSSVVTANFALISGPNIAVFYLSDKNMQETIPAAESSTVEFKRKWSETAKSTLSAFANTHGGAVYFGVDDDGEVVGVENPDELERTIVSVLRFATKPSCEEICRVSRMVVEQKVVVKVTVLEGNNAPYFITIKEEGAKKESKCFMRHETADYEVNDDELRALYRKGNPIAYEAQPSRMQNLTFETAGKYFSAAGIEFSERKHRILGLVDQVGFFTNLAYWLSDQCNVPTAIGFFAGTDRTAPVTEIHHLNGCIIEQYDKLRRLISDRFGFASSIAAFVINKDGTRNEVRDYPEAAVREALVNMFAHRDYSKETGLSSVNVYTDRMEFVSIGGVLSGIEVDELREGVSVLRNRALAEIFMRLSAMEKYGLGIPLIFEAYAGTGLEPEIRSTPATLRITLPKIRLNYPNLSGREAIVVNVLRSGPKTRRQLEEALGLSYGTTLRVVHALMARGVVEKTGSGPTTRYALLGE